MAAIVDLAQVDDNVHLGDHITQEPVRVTPRGTYMAVHLRPPLKSWRIERGYAIISRPGATSIATASMPSGSVEPSAARWQERCPLKHVLAAYDTSGNMSVLPCVPKTLESTSCTRFASVPCSHLGAQVGSEHCMSHLRAGKCDIDILGMIR